MLDQTTSDQTTSDPTSDPTSDDSLLAEVVRDYEWFHTWLGILGNVAFLVGSVFFLFEPLKTAGVWLFIVGAFGMLVGSVGRMLVDRARDG